MAHTGATGTVGKDRGAQTQVPAAGMDLAVAFPLGPQGSPVWPLELICMNRADSSPGTEPSPVSFNANRPWASPLHTPDQAGEALCA